ncbi:gamma-glutamyltransferase [Priestia flexa]|nr:gamma-glutamyltransferase [Priestia flexa]WHX77770.1 gamma-glutamyltransferase [Priestia flexa]
MKVLKSFFAIMLVFSVIAPVGSAEVPGVNRSMKQGATKGLVSVSHPLAAKVGKEVLENGGNAVDAAVAIQLSLNVVEPMMSGIGGGGFMMIYDEKENDIEMIDGREMAPADL